MFLIKDLRPLLHCAATRLSLVKYIVEDYFFFLMFPFVQIYYGKRPFCNYDWLQIVDSSQVVVLARGNQSFALQKSLQRLLRKHCILSLRTSTLIDKKKVVQTLKKGGFCECSIKMGGLIHERLIHCGFAVTAKGNQWCPSLKSWVRRGAGKEEQKQRKTHDPKINR